MIKVSQHDRRLELAGPRLGSGDRARYPTTYFTLLAAGRQLLKSLPPRPVLLKDLDPPSTTWADRNRLTQRLASLWTWDLNLEASKLRNIGTSDHISSVAVPAPTVTLLMY